MVPALAPAAVWLALPDHAGGHRGVDGPAREPTFQCLLPILHSPICLTPRDSPAVPQASAPSQGLQVAPSGVLALAGLEEPLRARAEGRPSVRGREGDPAPCAAGRASSELTLGW